MKLVYDMARGRPACALLQVVFGGDLGIADQFPPQSWLVMPTDSMRLYDVTFDQLGQAQAITDLVLQGYSAHDAFSMVMNAEI